MSNDRLEGFELFYMELNPTEDYLNTISNDIQSAQNDIDAPTGLPANEVSRIADDQLNGTLTQAESQKTDPNSLFPAEAHRTSS